MRRGVASLSLIPGMASAARTYQVAVVPPAGAAFASACLPDRSVVAGDDHAASPRSRFRAASALSGTVNAAAGVPVADVTVTASRDPATATVCEPQTGPDVDDDQRPTPTGKFELWPRPRHLSAGLRSPGRCRRFRVRPSSNVDVSG